MCIKEQQNLLIFIHLKCNRRYVTFWSERWSYGVLLYEIFTIGKVLQLLTSCVFRSFSYYYFVVKNIENLQKEERHCVIAYLRDQECIHYLYIFVFSAHVDMSNFLPTLKPPAAPYVIMASFSNKSADLLNVVTKIERWLLCMMGRCLLTQGF